MNKNKKICKLGFKISSVILLIQLVVFIILFIFINKSVSDSTHKTAVNNMITATVERSEIIGDYIKSSEDALTAYLKAEQIYNLMREPENQQYIDNAQKYTEFFGSDLVNLEGIYASKWDTTILTHTNPKIRGQITRPDQERQKQLHDCILATDGVYNTGIIISPASGEQIISMYKAVKDDDGNPIGLGGIGIFTSGLIEKLNTLPLEGFSKAQYYLINAETGEYIFHPDKEKITTIAEEEFVNNIISKVKENNSSGSLNYKDEKGKDNIAAFNSIKNYNWIFIISDESAEVLSSVTYMRIVLLIICAICMVLLATIVYIVISKLITPIKVIEDSIINLSDIKLDSANNIEEFIQRDDEIGNIANSVSVLCKSLKNVSEDIGRILEEISNENLAVDTSMNRQYYKGDFEMLSENLETIRNKLNYVIKNITLSAEHVNSSSQQIASVSNVLSEGTVEQNNAIQKLAENLGLIDNQVHLNSDNCSEATEIMDKTFYYVNEVNEKMEHLTNAMNNINDASTKISNIIKTIEDIAFQTNILSLNAAVEASRAGEAGKGFAVVADEVRNLAIKSAEAVSDTTKLIENSIEAVNNGVRITEQTTDAMKLLDKHSLTLKKIIDNISLSGEKQSEMVADINADINQISAVVQHNSKTAEESTNVSGQLSEQARLLNELIERFNLD